MEAVAIVKLAPGWNYKNLGEFGNENDNAYYLGNETLPILSVVVLIFSVGYLYLVGQTVVYALRKETAFSSKLDRFALWDFLREYLMATIYMTFLVQMVMRMVPEFYSDNNLI